MESGIILPIMGILVFFINGVLATYTEGHSNLRFSAVCGWGTATVLEIGYLIQNSGS